MKKIILVRYGEIILKGLNRPIFEEKLVKNIKNAIYELGKVSVIRSQGRIYVEPLDANYDFDEAASKLVKVFGIVSISIVTKLKSEFEEIKNYSVLLVKELMSKKNVTSFKVETKRGDKKFSLKSPEISELVGEHILNNFNNLKVDVINPDFIIYIEVREYAYIYTEKIHAKCGMPLGTNGKAMLLLSGGIDSPVAGFLIAKRGVEIEAIHFYSYPYTSERAKDKVIELTKILAEFCVKINLHIVPFTEIQLKIHDNCKEEESTIIMRRVMMAIAERVAKKNHSSALITGESIGQVASQTMQSLYVTNAAVKMPVFRPLIAMDKNEVIEIARKINTFETSILPYEDCCTVFVAKHPNTKPDLKCIIESESKLELENLIENAIKNIEVMNISSK